MHPLFHFHFCFCLWNLVGFWPVCSSPRWVGKIWWSNTADTELSPFQQKHTFLQLISFKVDQYIHICNTQQICFSLLNINMLRWTTFKLPKPELCDLISWYNWSHIMKIEWTVYWAWWKLQDLSLLVQTGTLLQNYCSVQISLRKSDSSSLQSS